MENKKLYEKHWIPDFNGNKFLAYAYQSDFRKFIQPFIEELIKKGIDWKGLDEQMHDNFLIQWEEKYKEFDGNYDALPEANQDIYKTYDDIVNKMLKDKYAK